jgi:MFS family permease
MVTAQGVGAVAGAIIVPGVAERVGRHRLLMWGFVALCGALCLYAAAPAGAFAVAALVLVGATYICVFSGLGAVVQLRAPAEMRARMVSIYFLALGVLYPIGATIQGPLADRIGLGQITAIGAGVLLVIFALLRVLRPERLAALDDLDAYPVAVAVPAGTGAT